MATDEYLTFPFQSLGWFFSPVLSLCMHRACIHPCETVTFLAFSSDLPADAGVIIESTAPNQHYGASKMATENCDWDKIEVMGGCSGISMCPQTHAVCRRCCRGHQQRAYVAFSAESPGSRGHAQ